MPLKKIYRKGHAYHIHYRRNGAYTFIKENLVKVLISVVVLVSIVVILNKLDLFNPKEDAIYLKEHFDTIPVFSILLLSEICIGLIPPPIFIFWAKEFSSPYLISFLLGVTSVTGGIISYFIGKWLHTLPRVIKWVDYKFKKQFDLFKKFGGLLIVISAVSPVSYPTVAMVSGVVKFPFKTFFFLSMFRFVKFMGWAYIIFEGLELF